MGVIMEVPTK